MTTADVEYATRQAHANELYNNLALDEAAAEYRSILAADPRDYAAQLGLARTLSRQRDHEQARLAIERCIEIDPNRPEAYVALGVLEFLLDHSAEARSALEKALSLSPNDPEALLTLAQVAADEGNREAADANMAAARAVIEAMPEGGDRSALDALAWHSQTYVLLTFGEGAAAREAAQQVIALQAANPYAASLAYSNLGILDAQEKHYDQAIDYLERAYSMNPRFYRAASALGRILTLRRQYSRAAEVLATVVEHPFSDQAMDRYVYGMALAKSGQREAALGQYRLALRHGLKGIFRLQAWWQTIWLSQWGRMAVIGAAVALVLIYVVVGKPQGSTLSLLVVAGVVLFMQYVLGRAKR